MGQAAATAPRLEVVNIAQIAGETDLTRQTVYRIKGIFKRTVRTGPGVIAKRRMQMNESGHWTIP
jgi:hypothetical protein